MPRIQWSAVAKSPEAFTLSQDQSSFSAFLEGQFKKRTKRQILVLAEKENGTVPISFGNPH
jgi:hypothetical protein